jgi:transposase
MEVVYPRCCGLDVHKDTVVACRVRREGEGRQTKETRTFGTVTEDLLALADWLREGEVTHVAMESTGSFWKPLYNVLADGFTVFVVNAAHVKAIPTDY